MAIVAAFCVAGCAATKGVKVIGEPRVAIADFNTVKILPQRDELPENAQVIARVQASYDANRMGAQGVDLMRERLRRHAASVGANAVALTHSPGPPIPDAGGDYVWRAFVGPRNVVAFQGLAIWLPPESPVFQSKGVRE